jgi:hypothetical protein
MMDIGQKIQEFVNDNRLVILFEPVGTLVTKLSDFLNTLKAAGEIIEWNIKTAEVENEGYYCKIYVRTEQGLPFYELVIALDDTCDETVHSELEWLD